MEELDEYLEAWWAWKHAKWFTPEGCVAAKKRLEEARAKLELRIKTVEKRGSKNPKNGGLEREVGHVKRKSKPSKTRASSLPRQGRPTVSE